VHLLRTVDDARRLHSALRSAGSVVVIGAGFIGLEVAASARALDCAVTIVDVLPAPLARVLPPEIGAAVRRLHGDNGVGFRFGTGVTEVSGAPVESVLLGDGSRVAADAVVVGIGVVPAVEWLTGSGLELDNGVLCDETLRAAPGVWAVGDVARWRQPDGRTTRLEHWTNATEQPQHVARAIVTGEPAPFVPVPYFWSDQYDAKLQALGYPKPEAEVHLAFGDLGEAKWVALLRTGDRLGAVVGLRAPGRVMRLRPLLDRGATWDEALATTG
jgi:NADPH-dependent 2,4-dienoyl-CoA reductase/sulfur reductase-like enzyme